MSVFQDIICAAIYLGPTHDSMQCEIAAMVYCTHAMVNYCVNGKWDLDQMQNTRDNKTETEVMLSRMGDELAKNLPSSENLR